MIVPQTFYRGHPNDGTAITNSVAYVQVGDLNAQVPTYKKWRIEEIVICNMTQVTGYYTVGIFPPSFTGSNVQQPNMGSMNADAPLPHSSAGGAGFVTPGYYIAYSQAIPPATTRTMPIVAYALGDEKLWAGVYPGYNAFLGAGGVSLSISGREYRD